MGSELGRRAKAIMDRGDLVPDELVIGIVEQRLAREDCRRGFILDGFPRTCDQARALDALLRRLGRAPARVVVLAVPEPELVRRLLQRGEGRADDNEQTIRKRLVVYLQATEPVLEHYGSSVARVDGLGTLDQIRGRIAAVLEAAA
jgi:adenylate kinase